MRDVVTLKDNNQSFTQQQREVLRKHSPFGFCFSKAHSGVPLPNSQLSSLSFNTACWPPIVTEAMNYLHDCFNPRQLIWGIRTVNETPLCHYVIRGL